MKRAPVTPASAAEVEAVLRRSEGASDKGKVRGARNYSIVATIERALAEGAGLMTGYDRAAAQHNRSRNTARTLWARVLRFPRCAWGAACIPAWSDRERPFYVESVPGFADFLKGTALERRGVLPVSKVARIGMAEFGIEPKHRSAIERYLRLFIQQNRSALTISTNPDRAKSLFLPAHGSMSQGKEPLEVCEFDGSAADVLTTEGRQTVLIMKDQASRAAAAVVGSAENGDLTARLHARFFSRWGVPRIERTDNGAAFRSLRVRTALERLGVRLEFVRPFSGELKPFAESGIRLLQGWCELEPGFAGHDVLQRQRLRGRLSMAARRGKAEAFVLEVRLSPRELEEHLNAFLDREAGRPRPELNGKTTDQIVAEAQARGARGRIEDEGALLMLFGRAAIATVGKRGIKFAGRIYVAAALGAIVGHRVEVRRHPDADKIAIFTLGRVPEFVCVAVDVDSLNPDQRRAEALAARAAFRVSTRSIRAAGRKLVKRLGGRSPADILLSARAAGEVERIAVPFSTAALIESGKAARAEADLALVEPRGAAADGAAKWGYFLELLARDSLTPAEQRWLAVYRATDADFAARMQEAS